VITEKNKRWIEAINKFKERKEKNRSMWITRKKWDKQALGMPIIEKEVDPINNQKNLAI